MLRSPTHAVRLATTTLTVLITAAVLTSCGAPKNEATQDQPMTTPTPEPTAEGTAGPDTAWTDASIAATVLAANTLDIENAQLAARITKNPAVTTLASQMIADHTLLNAKTNELAAKLTLIPRGNDIARGLASQARAKRDSLGNLTGAAFDRAYVSAEVVIHEGALDLLDHTLIPRAQNAELRTMLEGARPIFQGHLKHAQKVLASLKP